MTDGSSIVDYLKQFIGTDYAWGGNDLNKGVDCSGLIQQGFKHFGISLPRTTYDQIGEGTAVGMKGLRPGDLVFFDTDPNKPGPDHVGIYAGNGKMIEAPKPGGKVQYTDITSGYYLDKFMGGRRIDGVKSAGMSAADGITGETEVKMTPEEQAANYGWSYAFLHSNPELEKLFKQASAETWKAEKFQAELRDTKWWKTTSDTARQAQAMQKTDPATWQAQLAATEIQVRQMAAQVGAAIPQSQMKKIVNQVLKTGLDEDGLRNVLGKYVTFTKDGTLKGEAGMHEFTMKQYAASMGVKLDDQAIKNQAQLVIRKLATTQDFEDQIRSAAKSSFPGYEQAIDAGVTVKDLASPYQQMMAKELELPPDPNAIEDPIIRSAMNGLNKDGKPAGMSLTDFQSSLRNDPRWRSTSSARDKSMDIGAGVLRDMGLIADGGSDVAMDLMDLLYDVGFRGNGLKTAYAIAMAESSGNARNYNGKGLDRSYGLFQINMYGDMGPDRRKRYGLSKNEDLFDPRTNAEIAFKMSNGGKNWQPWSTYTTNRYLDYYGQNGATVKNSSYKSSGSSGGGGGGGKKAPIDAAATIEEYGYVKALMNSDPELKKIFNKIKTGEIASQGKFNAELQDTKWWKTHSATAKKFIGLQYGDPAEAKRQLDAAKIKVRQLAESMGIRKGPGIDDKIDVWALHMVMDGWDDSRLRWDIGKSLTSAGDVRQGEFGDAIDKLEDVAYNMGVTMSGHWYADAGRSIVRGTGASQDYEDQLRKQAKAMFPTWSKQIDAGQTVADLASPYLSSMAQILELPPGQVNLFDPTIKKALQYKDPKTGQSQPKALWQFETEVRSDGRWKSTQNAQNSMMQVAHQILADFGVKT